MSTKIQDYTGCMVLNAAGTVGTVIQKNNQQQADYHYYTVAWYRQEGVAIMTAIHYTHVAGWRNNLLNKLKSDGPVNENR
jgi:hypothetical protein